MIRSLATKFIDFVLNRRAFTFPEAQLEELRATFAAHPPGAPLMLGSDGQLVEVTVLQDLHQRFIEVTPDEVFDMRFGDRSLFAMKPPEKINWQKEGF